MLKIFNYNNYFKYNVKFRGGFTAIYASTVINHDLHKWFNVYITQISARNKNICPTSTSRDLNITNK